MQVGCYFFILFIIFTIMGLPRCSQLRTEVACNVTWEPDTATSPVVWIIGVHKAWWNISVKIRSTSENTDFVS